MRVTGRTSSPDWYVKAADAYAAYLAEVKISRSGTIVELGIGTTKGSIDKRAVRGANRWNRMSPSMPEHDAQLRLKLATIRPKRPNLAVT
jgi:hypothetical protein